MRMFSTFYSSVLESKWTCVYSDRQMIISKRFSKIYGFRGLPDRCRVTHKIKLLKKHTAHLLITYGYFICTSQQWQYCYRISLSFYCRVVPLARYDDWSYGKYLPRQVMDQVMGLPYSVLLRRNVSRTAGQKRQPNKVIPPGYLPQKPVAMWHCLK